MAVVQSRSCENGKERLQQRTGIETVRFSNDIPDSLDRVMAGERLMRRTCQSASSTQQRHVETMDVLFGMGYRGPVYKSLMVGDKREALLRAQADGDIRDLRAALRAAQLHIGLDDPTVKRMREILKEADWAIRICGQDPSMSKIADVVRRLNDLNLGPSKWKHPILASSRAKLAAFRARGLQSDDEEQRKTACNLLQSMGEAASQHAAEVCKLFIDSLEVRLAAGNCVKRMGQGGALACAECLAHPNPKSRKAACEALGAMKQGAVHAALVVKLLQDVEVDVQKAAFLAFEAFGSEGAIYVDAVAAGLEDADPGIRRLACQALAVMGTSALKHAGAVVERMEHDEDREVKTAARNACRRFAALGWTGSAPI